MVSSGPIVRALAAVAAAALVLSPSTRALCGPCSPMAGVMDCCDHGPGPAGSAESCPGDTLRAPEPSPPAADLSAPAPAPAPADGLRSASTENRSPRLQTAARRLRPTPGAPELYLLHASFLI